MLGLVEVLLCDENTLCAEESVWLLHSVAAPGLDKSVEDQKRKPTAEEVLVNELTVGLGNQHLDD